MGRRASYHVVTVPGELDTAYAGVEYSKASAEWPATRVVDSDIGPSLGCRELVRIIEVDPEPRRAVLDRIPADGRSHGVSPFVWRSDRRTSQQYIATHFVSHLSRQQLCVTTSSKIIVTCRTCVRLFDEHSLDEHSLIVSESAELLDAVEPLRGIPSMDLILLTRLRVFSVDFPVTRDRPKFLGPSCC